MSALPSLPTSDMNTADLGELMGAFTEVATKLEATHQRLRAEVARLEGELREANEQLARKERLAALGEMAAGIAHEVRNPLGSISLHAGILEGDLPPDSEERTLACKIRAAVRGLDAVVSDVLTFSKEMPVRPMEVSTEELCERAISEAIAGVDGGSSVQVELDVAAAESIECDAHLAHRAMVNVVRNAVEAMVDTEPERPRVLSVSARPARSRAGSSRGAVSGIAIRVRDTGPGVPDSVRDRMFNPFFTTRESGTGLGLAIVHRIMDAHGGATSVRTIKPGKGKGGGRNAGAQGAEVELLFPADPGMDAAQRRVKEDAR